MTHVVQPVPAAAAKRYESSIRLGVEGQITSGIRWVFNDNEAMFHVHGHKLNSSLWGSVAGWNLLAKRLIDKRFADLPKPRSDTLTA